MSSKLTVLIIGCGIAGPVLANFLQRKGYNPIVFEKVPQLGDAGASLLLMPNGIKVLSLVGVTSELEKDSIDLSGFLELSSDGEQLGFSTLPTTFREKYGEASLGVKRTDINLKLKDMIIKQGIDIREGWELEDIQENESSVTAFFKDKGPVTGSFLIGCDGIKAASRRLLLAQKGLTEGLPDFMGMTQTAGLSSTPEALKKIPAKTNWYGEGVHVISYPVSADVTSFAVTLPEASGQEADWGLVSEQEMSQRKEKLLSQLSLWKDQTPRQLVEGAFRMIKFGLFDRQDLGAEHWYSRRCVLVGDAAHPTSPHLGQGANQALEDCFHLSHALPYLDSQSDSYQSDVQKLESSLVDIFRAYAEKRQPRTSVLVKGARAQGKQRVITTGPEDCKRRNQQLAKACSDEAALAATYDALLREPFQGSPV
ncbi:hypothetical protein PV10_02889 [Exophiala mesophila]|uniref:FAD-binding domain-containing protein n=1 Tax=Exophiala mesophila TaxID=212818 RepID=A0A0D1X0B9_EXOME|nr:uncharacterized protein PV10_02889 [Exophiala mesophila]KIV95210.1 hypothetical protein PV10_02889 [Exophiala mesophila]